MYWRVFVMATVLCSQCGFILQKLLHVYTFSIIISSTTITIAHSFRQTCAFSSYSANYVPIENPRLNNGMKLPTSFLEHEIVFETDAILGDSNSLPSNTRRNTEVEMWKTLESNFSPFSSDFSSSNNNKHLKPTNKTERLSMDDLFSIICSFPSSSNKQKSKQDEHILSQIDDPGSKDRKNLEKRGQESRILTFEANLHIKSLMEKSLRDTSPLAPHARAAECILNHLEKSGIADTFSYNLVINAYAKSRFDYSVQKIEEILERMEIVYKEQCQHYETWKKGDSARSNSIGHNHQWSNNHPSTSHTITVKPDVRTYSIIINAYSHNTQSAKVGNMKEQSSELSNAQAAQDLLDRLISLYKETGDPELEPNVVTYNTVLNVWAKSYTLKGAQMAEEILKSMEDKNLADVISYNAVIHAWARCGEKESGEQAESILRRMETVQPNFRTYSSVIDAWSQSGQPDSAIRAQTILEEVESLYAKTKNSDLQPNTILYSSVINAYAKSTNIANKAREAAGLLKRMQELYYSGENVKVKPSIVTFNNVLNVCATSDRYCNDNSYNSESIPINNDDFWEEAEPFHGSLNGMKESDGLTLARQIVKMIYKELVSNSNSKISPDHFTYGTILKACTNIMHPKHDEDDATFVREVFEQCCMDGQVTYGVCFQLKQAAPCDLYQSLIPAAALNPVNNHFEIKELPKEWTRNVKEKRRKKRKLSP